MKALVIGIVIVIGGITGAVISFATGIAVGRCSQSTGTGSDGSSVEPTAVPGPTDTQGKALVGTVGDGDSNYAYFDAVRTVSKGDSRIVLSMYVGGHLESSWHNNAVGANSYGVLQIQGPSDSPPVVHPDITIVQAENPVFVANYMYSTYLSALKQVPNRLWKTNPGLAAEQVAFHAERPQVDYLRGPYGRSRVTTAVNASTQVMKRLGISMDFGSSNQQADVYGTTGSSEDTGAECSSDTDDSGDSPKGIATVNGKNGAQLAAAIKAEPSRVNYIFGSQKDINNAASGKNVIPGPIGGAGATMPCKDRTPVPLSPQLLAVILTISEKYQITLASLVSNHNCDTGRHPLGRAVDISAVNGIPLDYSGAHMAFIESFVRFVMSVLPKGFFINGSPVNMGGVGQQECLNPMITAPRGINYFPDSCDHLHVDVGTSR